MIPNISHGYDHKSSNKGNYQPIISVIIAVLNGEKYLDETILSVVNQTYPSIELLVIDGDSQDHTVDIIKKYRSKINYWISEPDDGIYDAWNKALKQCKGDWICFLGSDDYIPNSKYIEQSIPYLKNAEDTNRFFVYGKVHKIDTDTQKILEIVGKPWDELKDRFVNFMCLPHPGSFHHKELFSRNGLYDPSFRIAGDYDLLLRELVTNKGDAMFIPLHQANMRVDGRSASFRNGRLLMQEVKMARNKNEIKGNSLEYTILNFRFMVISLIHSILGRKNFERIKNLYRRYLVINIIDGKFKISFRKTS